jgi:hypothetical protein
MKKMPPQSYDHDVDEIEGKRFKRERILSETYSLASHKIIHHIIRPSTREQVIAVGLPLPVHGFNQQ